MKFMEDPSWERLIYRGLHWGSQPWGYSLIFPLFSLVMVHTRMEAMHLSHWKGGSQMWMGQNWISPDTWWRKNLKFVLFILERFKEGSSHCPGVFGLHQAQSSCHLAPPALGGWYDIDIEWVLWIAKCQCRLLMSCSCFFAFGHVCSESGDFRELLRWTPFWRCMIGIRTYDGTKEVPSKGRPVKPQTANVT